MIPYVDTQLSMWGKWVVSKSAKGLGFSPISPMFKDMRHGGVYASQPPMGVTLDSAVNISDTDAAVQRLDQVQRQLAYEFYVRSGKGVEVAARLGIAKRTLYDRINALHQAVLGHLNDVVAEIN